LAVAPTVDFIAAFVTTVLEEAVAEPVVRAGIVPPLAGEVAILAVPVERAVPPVAAELAAVLPPVKAFLGVPDENGVRLVVVPGVREGKFRL